MSSINILHLETSSLDAEMIRSKLAREVLGAQIHLVDRPSGLIEALQARRFDLILADASSSGIDGLSGLEIARAYAPDTPILSVLDAVGEEVAIESHQEGATAFVLKCRLDQLGPAVDRALAEARERAERRKGEAVLLPNSPLAREFRGVREGRSGDVRPGTRVLLVDDHRDSAGALASLLRVSGFDVRWVQDGLEAIPAAKAHRAEAILLDIGLPGMDGYQVAERLRREEDLQETTIIAITGYGEEQAFRRSREAGFDHHLVKPVNFDVLLDLLLRDHRALEINDKGHA